MPDQITIGQIGCGYWGPNVLRNFSAQSGCWVKYVAEVNPERQNYVRANFPRSGVVSDVDAVLSDAEVDAVIVATPAASHYALAKQALEARKHVFVEKPLATSTEHADELVKLAASTGKTLMVGHTFLYNAAVRRMKQYVDDGDLGDVLYIYSQRLNLGRVRNDVNALWNFAPHDVSILVYLLDQSPSEVSARGFAYLQPGVEDVVFMTLVFPNGASANVHISWLDPHKIRKMTVVGSRKMAVYDDVSSDARIVVYDRGVDRVPTADSPRDFKSFADFQLRLRSGDVTIPAIKFSEPLQLECEHFIDCIHTSKRPLTDGRHGAMVVRVLEAAQESMGRGGAAVRIES